MGPISEVEGECMFVGQLGTAVECSTIVTYAAKVVLLTYAYISS